MRRFFTPSSCARIVAAGLLFYALKRNAYGYYTLLRWVVFASAGYSAYVASNTLGGHPKPAIEMITSKPAIENSRQGR